MAGNHGLTLEQRSVFAHAHYSMSGIVILLAATGSRLKRNYDYNTLIVGVPCSGRFSLEEELRLQHIDSGRTL